MDNPTPPSRRILIGIIGVFILLGTLYSITIPPFEISDEWRHYPVIDHLIRQHDLPVLSLDPAAPDGPWHQEGGQPPLYYILNALSTAWIDRSDFDQVYRVNPHAAAGVATLDGNNLNLTAHPPAAPFPWRGTLLAVHLSRLLSVLFGAWGVYLTWTLARELYPEPAWLAPAAAALHAFLPMYVFITASINNDALAVPLSSLALLLIARRVRQSRPAPPWLLGLVVGAAILTKESTLALLPFAAVALAYPYRTFSPGWLKRLLRDGAEFLGPLLLVAGWWYLRNARLYGDPLGLNAFLATAGGRTVPADLAQIWAERFSFMAGFWGNFGGLNILMPEPVYTLLNFIALVALAGMGLRGIERLRRPGTSWLQPWRWDPQTMARALIWTWPLAVLISWYRWTLMTMASQGRLIFYALAPLTLGLAWGLSAWIPRRSVRGQIGAAAVPAGFLLALSAIALPAWIRPAYTPPPALTAEARAAIPTPLAADFDGTLRLLGYAVESPTLIPGMPAELTLYWEAGAPTATDHSVFIHLLGEGNRIIAQRDSFPGHGLLPTRYSESGRTWAEHYRIPIPPMAYTPDTLTVSIGVYETATGQRRPIRTADPAQVADNSLRFGRIALAPRPDQPYPNALDVRIGESMALVGYDVSALTVHPGDPFTMTLHWECRAPMDADYTVSLQLIDTQWRKIAQNDSWPAGTATSDWTPGQSLEETRTFTIASDAQPGIYDLRLTVYSLDAAGQIRPQPITWQAGQDPLDALILTRIAVP